MAELSGPVSAVTYQDEDGARHIHAFVPGANGRLYMNHWNGSKWEWVDRGLAPGGKKVFSVAAIAYSQILGSPRFRAFVTAGAERPTRLYSNAGSGSGTWTDIGAPPGEPRQLGTPTAVAYAENGILTFRAFVTGGTLGNTDNNLYKIHAHDGSWQWVNQTSPNSGHCGATGAVTYLDPNKKRQIHAFTGAGNLCGALAQNVYDGSDWRWIFHGTPSNGSGLGISVSSDGVISYPDGIGQHRIHTFVGTWGKDAPGLGHLFDHTWNGSKWQWVDRGQPGNVGVGAPAAITYKDGAGRQRIYTFVYGFDHNLYVNYWDGASWHWANQKNPQPISGAPAVVTYKQGDAQRIYVFITDDTNLHVNYWDGKSWHWANQGHP